MYVKFVFVFVSSIFVFETVPNPVSTFFFRAYATAPANVVSVATSLLQQMTGNRPWKIFLIKNQIALNQRYVILT